MDSLYMSLLYYMDAFAGRKLNFPDAHFRCCLVWLNLYKAYNQANSLLFHVQLLHNLTTWVTPKRSMIPASLAKRVS